MWIQNFKQCLLCLFLMYGSSSMSQSPSPQKAVNPWLGWSWQKTQMHSLDPSKTPVMLHYKLQKSATAPAVLIGHDNGGITQNELIYADHVFEQGFHVFINDRVTARDRVATPLESFIVEDTFAAVAFIKKQFANQIPTERLSFVSFSGDGGFGGLMAIEPLVRKHFSDSDPDQFKFHRVVAIYPHCLNMKGRQPDTPALIIGAELDGSDPAVCQNVYANFPAVKVQIFNGAFHGFDQIAVKQKTWIQKPVIMPGRCEWTVDLRSVHERQGKRYFGLLTPEGHAQNTPEFGRYNSTCHSRQSGYFSEYRADYTRKAYELSVAFMQN